MGTAYRQPRDNELPFRKGGHVGFISFPHGRTGMWELSTYDWPRDRSPWKGAKLQASLDHVIGVPYGKPAIYKLGDQI